MRADFFPNPEFDAFLYASVGEDNGMPLSVLSALARQNVDAWDVARQLVLLPKESAIRLLASMMAMIPAGSGERPVPEEIAARLVALLPKSSTRARAAKAVPSLRGSPPAPAVNNRLRLAVAFALFALAGYWLIANLTAPPNPGAAAPSRAAQPSPHNNAPAL